MKTWEIWAEGYRDRVGSGAAAKLGEVEAETFREACDKLLGGAAAYDPEPWGTDGPVFWDRRLYDNEQDALRMYG